MPELSDQEIEDLADEALNAACLVIQQRLGIEEGGWAGMYFSGDHPIDEILRGYIRSEIEWDKSNAEWKREPKVRAKVATVQEALAAGWMRLYEASPAYKDYKNPEHCGFWPDPCAGWWFTDQYHYSGYIGIERCDMCERFDSDWQAALHVADQDFISAADPHGIHVVAVINGHQDGFHHVWVKLAPRRACFSQGEPH